MLDVVLNNINNEQTFVENVNFPVSSVEFDPELHLISKNNNVTLHLENNNLITENIFLFPNPINDILSIETSENIKINSTIIYNTLGKKIIESTNKQINLSQLSTGIYFISIFTNDGYFHKKIIKN
jgi:hypothetical protein